MKSIHWLNFSWGAPLLGAALLYPFSSSHGESGVIMGINTVECPNFSQEIQQNGLLFQVIPSGGKTQNLNPYQSAGAWAVVVPISGQGSAQLTSGEGAPLCQSDIVEFIGGNYFVLHQAD